MITARRLLRPANASSPCCCAVNAAVSDQLDTLGCRLFCSSSSGGSNSIVDILQREYGHHATSPHHDGRRRPPQASFSPQQQAFLEEAMATVQAIIAENDAAAAEGSSDHPSAVSGDVAAAVRARMTPSQEQVEAQRIVGDMPSASVVRLLMEKLRKRSWLELDHDMRRYKIRLKPSEVACVLKAQKHVMTAWDFFKWAAERPGYKHDSTCYAVMLNVLATSSEYYLLEELLCTMERLNVPHTLITIGTLIKAYVATQQINKAELAWGRLQQLGLQPTLQINKCMLMAFVKLQDTTKALEYYRIMERSSQALDTCSYNMLLDELAKCGQVETVWDIFRNMKKHDNNIDFSTYSILARSLTNDASGAGRAQELLEELHKNGTEPDKQMLGAILVALASQDKVEIVLNLFKSILDQGVNPDFTIYEAVAKMLCSRQEFNQACKLLRNTENTLIKKLAYESFIKVVGKMGFMREVCVLFQTSKNEGMEVDPAVYISMIDALCKTAKPDEALVVLEEMENSGSECNIVACNSIITAFCNKNKSQAGYDLFIRLKERGVSPNMATYNTLIAGLVKAEKMGLAEGLLKEMEKCGHTPNVVTYNAFLHSYSRSGDAESMHRLLHLMRSKGINPDVITYNRVIQFFCKTGKPELALEVLAEMKTKGCIPSSVVYNTTLQALAKSGLTESLFSLYQQMKDQGIMPDATTVVILHQVCEKSPLKHKRQFAAEIQRSGLRCRVAS